MVRLEIQSVKHSYSLTATQSNAPTLVFIHGWLLSRHYWQPLVEHLAPSYRCLSYDLRGFGGSQFSLDTRPTRFSCYTPESYAEDLMVLLKKLEIDRAWLVGHSLGGTIALFGADKLPGQVQGVICINSGGGIYLKEEFERFRAAGEQIVKFRPPWLRRLPLVDAVFARSQVDRPLKREWGRQRLIDFVAAHPEAALGALLDSTTEAEVHRLPRLVTQLQQPVYFITGEKDRVMEPKYVRHLASFHWLFRQGEDNVLEIPNCGHLAMVEYPDMSPPCAEDPGSIFRISY
ncbi:MAG: alpha/beta hydrolase [Oscillatoriales cyanobacterium RM1_1_9]|nr:alpha/beta hydrolase [Oscillatoriales cyanobacterium RM1_1_9]